MTFRDAHEVVGKAVAFGLQEGRDLSQMTLAQLQSFASIIEQDVFDVLTLEGSVRSRNHFGGTAPEQVHLAVANARQALEGSGS